jgi:hypothetical protein
MLRIVPVWAVVGMLVLPAVIHDAFPARACTGSSGLQYAAQSAGLIVIGDAIDVGDGIKRAPTITPLPTSTPAPTATATPIFGPHGVAPTPVSPPIADPATFAPYAPEGFSLTGYGVMLRTVRTVVGSRDDVPEPLAILRIDEETRSEIERELRQREGRHFATDCAPDAFAFRYTSGARYLVFAGNAQLSEHGLFTLFRLRVDGGDVVLNDPGLPGTEITGLDMTAEQYHRFFEGVEATFQSPEFANITAPRVPLASVIRLIADIRGGDVRVAPPDTGSAGLLPQATR